MNVERCINISFSLLYLDTGNIDSTGNMTSYTIDDSELKSLQGKTILITGAATGIGEATFRLAIGERIPNYSLDISENTDILDMKKMVPM